VQVEAPGFHKKAQRSLLFESRQAFQNGNGSCRKEAGQIIFSSFTMCKWKPSGFLFVHRKTAGVKIGRIPEKKQTRSFAFESRQAFYF